MREWVHRPYATRSNVNTTDATKASRKLKLGSCHRHAGAAAAAADTAPAAAPCNNCLMLQAMLSLPRDYYRDSACWHAHRVTTRA